MTAASRAVSPACSVPAEHRAGVEGEHVGIAAPRDQLHNGEPAIVVIGGATSTLVTADDQRCPAGVRTGSGSGPPALPRRTRAPSVARCDTRPTAAVLATVR